MVKDLAVGGVDVAGAFWVTEFALPSCALRLSGSARIAATETTARDFMILTPATPGGPELLSCGTRNWF